MIVDNITSVKPGVSARPLTSFRKGERIIHIVIRGDLRQHLEMFSPRSSIFHFTEDDNDIRYRLRSAFSLLIIECIGMRLILKGQESFFFFLRKHQENYVLIYAYVQGTFILSIFHLQH